MCLISSKSMGVSKPRQVAIWLLGLLALCGFLALPVAYAAKSPVAAIPPVPLPVIPFLDATDGLAISPTSVDISVSSADVLVTLHVNDSTGTFFYAAIIATDSLGNTLSLYLDLGSTTVAGTTPYDYYLSNTLTIPQGSTVGDWSLSIVIYDYSGNQINLDTPILINQGWPSILTVSSGGSSADTTPPQLAATDGLTITPTSVDVSTSAANVSVNLHVTDDKSGVDHALAYLVNPGKNIFQAVNFTTNTGGPGVLDATLTGNVSIPQSAPTGDWTLLVTLYDVSGNKKTLAATDLVTLGFTPTVTVASATINTSDTTPPQLVPGDGLDFNPKAVDVTQGDATVTLDLHVVDDLSGINYGSLYFYNPSSTNTVSGYFGANTVTPELDGHYQASFTIPQYSQAGDWQLSMNMNDRVGNSQYLGAADLAKLGFPTTLAVTSIADTTPPQLNSFSFTPGQIDVSTGMQQVTLTMDISDAQSGLSVYNGWNIWLQPPVNQGYSYSYSAAPTTGTIQAGTWQITYYIPQYAAAGDWKLSNFTLIDNAGNQTTLSYTDLQKLGTPSLTVIANPSDIQAPKLTNLTFSPTFVDTASASQAVNVNFSANDDIAGVYGMWVNFTSPSGNQTQSVYIYGKNPIAGNQLNGSWQGSLNMPQYSEAGTWQLNYVSLNDNTFNYRTVYKTELQALGINTSLEVIRPSQVVDGNISNPAQGGTISDATFGDRASLTVPAGVLSTATQISIDVLSANLQLPVPAGFSITGTNYVDIKLSPEPSFPLPAPGMTVVLPTANQMPAGTVLTLYRIDTTTGYLVPEPNISGNPTTGTVNSDGMSATFTGLARLSTVVGLQASASLAGDLNGDNAVDCADIAIVRNAFGKKLKDVGFDARADTNHDNVVNVRDLSFVSRSLQSKVKCVITPTGATTQSVTTANITRAVITGATTRSVTPRSVTRSVTTSQTPAGVTVYHVNVLPKP